MVIKCDTFLRMKHSCSTKIVNRFIKIFYFNWELLKSEIQMLKIRSKYFSFTKELCRIRLHFEFGWLDVQYFRSIFLKLIYTSCAHYKMNTLYCYYNVLFKAKLSTSLVWKYDRVGELLFNIYKFNCNLYKKKKIIVVYYKL